MEFCAADASFAPSLGRLILLQFTTKIYSTTCLHLPWYTEIGSGGRVISKGRNKKGEDK
jgi:hypothetical protein